MHFLSTGVEDSRRPPALETKTKQSIYLSRSKGLLQLLALLQQWLLLQQLALSHPLPMDMPDICFVGQQLGNPEP
jgi:hypothetical protein